MGIKDKNTAVTIGATEEQDLSTLPGFDEPTALGRMILRPTFRAATALAAYDNIEESDELLGLMVALTEQTDAANTGDLKRAESMLVTQAHTLDAIFNNLAKRAIKAADPNQLDKFLKLALRAQSQCRSTWEALATIKNPPMAGYVHQANIAHGPQQVNNGPAESNHVPIARENENLQNKLLEERDGERLDTGETGTTGRVDSAMATLGKIDRS